MSAQRSRTFEPASRAPQPTAPTPPGTDSLVDTSHGTIAVRQSSGEGLPVVLLHELSCGKDVFDMQLRSGFGQVHRLIAIDLPGHGASGDAIDPERTYSVPGFADAVVEVLEALDIDTAAAVGWSLGGNIALELISSFPGLVGVMLTGTAPIAHGLRAPPRALRPYPPAGFAIERDLSDDEARSLAEIVGGAASGPDLAAAIRQTDARARPHLMRSIVEGNFADERALLETFNIPIAVVNGSEDRLVDLDQLQTIAYAALWRGACHTIPRAGHAPFLDAPSVFNLLLSSFLADMEARARDLADNPTLVYSA